MIDDEDRLHHRSGDMPAERFGAAADLQALDRGDDADDHRHERRLDQPGKRWCDRSMAHAQAVDEGDRRDVGIDPGNQDAAAERREIGGDRQARQRDDQRHQPRKNQHADRIEADDRQRVDLLAHLHRADLGGDGAARAAGDHDRRHQHAEFAQHQDADQIDDEDVGAEIAQLEAPCWATIAPTMADISTTTGMAPTPMRSIWLKIAARIDAVAASELHLGAADGGAENVHRGQKIVAASS